MVSSARNIRLNIQMSDSTTFIVNAIRPAL